MNRPAALLAALLVACTGGPIDTDVEDTDDTSDTADTSDTDTAGDTGDPALDADDEAVGLYEDCTTAAAGGNKLVAGNYSGTTDNWGAHIQSDCVDNLGPGPEKLFLIDVPANNRLVVDYKLTGNDSRLYFLDDCAQPDTCLAYSNTQGGNQSEHIAWLNTTTGTRTITVVLDSRDSAEPGEAWTLAVSLEPYVPLPVADSCAGIGAITPITASGTWPVEMTGFVNDYNANTNFGCTGDSSGGVDGVVPVTLVDGATVTVSWGHASCDASVYLLETCGSLGTCHAGEDLAASGAAETFTWTNTTGADHTFTLVLDHFASSTTLCIPSATSPSELEITIDPPVTVGADTCGDAAALAPVPPGEHYVILGSAGDDLDLADAAESCTGLPSPGDDVFLPVSVAAGLELRAKVTAGHGDPAVYVVTDCADADTCVAGLDGEVGEVRWINETAATVDVFVVIDSQHAAGHGEAPPSALLELDVFPPLGDIPLADACVDLATTPMVGAGTHVIVMDDFSNNIDLGAGNSCTGWSGVGTDGMVNVRVRSGWTIDAEYDAGCDGQLYLLTGCGGGGTCLDGADSGSNTEFAAWTNDTGSTVDVVVVMDAWSSCRPTRLVPGELIVDLIPPPSVAADTCALALAKASVTEGTHAVDLSTWAADYDVSAIGGCESVATSTGADAYVPITLGPGEAVELAFTAANGLASFYLLDDCDTTPVCLDGTDTGSPDLLFWQNDFDVTRTVVAVIDTNATDLHADEPQSGSLEVYFDEPASPLTASDTCAGAIAPTPPGRYEIDLAGFVADLDLASGTGLPCTDEIATPGVDAFLQIEVPAGARADLVWDVSGSALGSRDGSLYLLSACDADECLVGSDSGEPEELTYTNTTASTQVLYVGLDSFSATSPTEGVLTYVRSP